MGTRLFSLRLKLPDHTFYDCPDVTLYLCTLDMIAMSHHIITAYSMRTRTSKPYEATKIVTPETRTQRGFWQSFDRSGMIFIFLGNVNGWSIVPRPLVYLMGNMHNECVCLGLSITAHSHFRCFEFESKQVETR